MSPKHAKKAGARLRELLESKINGDPAMPPEAKEAALLAIDLLVGLAVNIADLVERR